MRLCIPILLALTFCCSAQAELVTYHFTGELRYDSILGVDGSAIEGSIIYDTNTPPLLLSNGNAIYGSFDGTGVAPMFHVHAIEDDITIFSSGYATLTVMNGEITGTLDTTAFGGHHLTSSPDLSIPSGLPLAIVYTYPAGTLGSVNIPNEILPPPNVEFTPQIRLGGDIIADIRSNLYIPPGDLNRDGFVGIEDLGHVLARWNQTVPPSDPIGDPTRDGFVGIEDLNIVLGNWNAGAPPSALTANVPEPYTAALVLLALPFIFAKRS